MLRILFILTLSILFFFKIVPQAEKDLMKLRIELVTAAD